MARLIGMDEAGLGPNLGPFVVAVTVWDVPRQFDFWQSFAEVLTNQPKTDDCRLHIADSKQVFTPHRGFGALERGVLAALRLTGASPASHDELIECLRPDENSLPPMPRGPLRTLSLFDDEELEDVAPMDLVSADGELGSTSDPCLRPWYREHPVDLPFEDHDFDVVEHWQTCCEQLGARLIAVKATVVEPCRFNQLVNDYQNKSLVVSRLAFQLLRSVWDPSQGDTLVVGDKHGGRNRYQELLSEILDGQRIKCLEESAELSRYRVGKTEMRFQPRAEEYGPVALASMTAKYLRELAMTRFNRYWARHVDGLKPTQGYPTDAVRFHRQISDAQQRLGISNQILWRVR